MAHLSDGARHRLRQIAEVLDCPVADFFGQPATRLDLAAAAELLGLWLAVSDGAGRDKLLDCAREIAGLGEDCKAVAG